MAQVIAPETWVEGIDDNRLLPSRYTVNLFNGSGVNIANNNEACRVYDIVVPDYITDYDDRRLNGLAGPSKNPQGNDGWAASSYGVFQDVRFDSRVYTMGRHRSMAWRLFHEMQYSGDIGEWGTATDSNVITNGEHLMAVAQMLSKARDIWEKQILGPDIDKYNLFAVMNGHISGRWVENDPDRICSGDCAEGKWIAQPGPWQGQDIPPRFAPIHCIEWDDNNIPLLLSTIKTTWNNLFIPEDSRKIIIDPHYEYKMLIALTGTGVPATDSAYADVRDGNFTRLMGWDISFDIPSMYWPYLYVDKNLNVVHSATGADAFDTVLNSIAGGDNPDLVLENQLVGANRMGRPNFIRTVWNKESGKFEKKVTNYPLGLPVAAPYYGEKVDLEDADFAQPDTYPFSAPGSGYGLKTATGPQNPITRQKVIGCAVYTKAAQLSQEYSNMLTEDGGTRGKFTECVFDVKYDAWVIESLSQGILPIIDAQPNTGAPAVKVEVTKPIPQADPEKSEITDLTVDQPTISLKNGQEAIPVVTVTGTGPFDDSYIAFSSDTSVATVDDNGRITCVADTGQATITYRSVQDPIKTAAVTVNAQTRD